ncbi:class A sortase [Enterococcus faecium]|uniref:class A sortase n=1 Tax=Enterococcus faecium TaxID=1352 RepID=UPI001E439097|nr:class A sortase [Enterococcus faecium]MDB7485044.1 class A sortase [Enterococcus faecium]MDB7490098.1 class A sortase [Enterococcus faecium]MDB7492652.1 class A sortase [Enterococcus faecium]MDB7495246.1 class A sortase [Enterococcus faecium]MDB7497790.1 class A sortase [Enterococcus faecium]
MKVIKKVLVILSIAFISLIFYSKAYVYFVSKDTVDNVAKYNDTEIMVKSDNTDKDIKEIKEKIEVKTEELNKENISESIEKDNEVEEIKAITSKSRDYLNIKEVPMANKYKILAETEDIVKLGSIYISDLDIKLPIFKGKPLVKTSKDTMLFGATTNLENQVMGRGNYVLASHIVDNPNLLFTSIHTLEKGSYIYLYDSNYSYEYRVYKNFEVYNTETWILNDIKDYNILTLYTCVPDGKEVPEKRTVIRAVLTDIREL